MTLEEAKAAIEDLKAQGETEDDILKVLYLMFTKGEFDVETLRALVGTMGYEFTEEFEAMSDDDKKTKGWEQEDDPEKAAWTKKKSKRRKNSATMRAKRKSLKHLKKRAKTTKRNAR